MDVLFWLTLAAVTGLDATLLVTLAMADVRIWPPPGGAPTLKTRAGTAIQRTTTNHG